MTESKPDASMSYDVGVGGADKDGKQKEATESGICQIEVKESSKLEENFPKHVKDDNDRSIRGAYLVEDAGEVNMEAAMTTDDVMRAGGFGARDDIGSFLPVASDSTDFEASLRSARDFEEPQGETLRPGLGWTESVNEK